MTRVPGVIAVKPVHLVEKGERDKVTEAKNLAIDIGASSKAEAERLVQRGDCAVFAADFRTLAGEGSAWRTVQGKAFDDRAGCAIVAELLKERYPFDLSAAFTVQEEVGLRGARVAAYAENPQVAIVLECTGANEVPTTRDVSPNTRIGQGPAISMRDGSFIADPRLVEHVGAAARALGIRHQYKPAHERGHRRRGHPAHARGVASITIAVPARYIHSPAAIMDLNDFDLTIRSPGRRCSACPGRSRHEERGVKEHDQAADRMLRPFRSRGGGA